MDPATALKKKRERLQEVPQILIVGGGGVFLRRLFFGAWGLEGFKV